MRKCGIQWHSLALRGIEIVIVVIHWLNKVSNRARQICTTIERLVQHDKGCSRKYRTGGWACKHFCPPYPVQNFFFGLPPTSEVYQYLSLPYPALLPLNSACSFFATPTTQLRQKMFAGSPPCTVFSGTALMYTKIDQHNKKCNEHI